MAKSKSQKKPRKNKLKGRERRLSKAPNWVIAHRGKPSNMLKRYRKYFGIDWECAIYEIEALGFELDELYLSRLRDTLSRDFQNEKKHTPISRWEFDQYHGIEPESDDTFEYIAGYTPGGAPYGVTWEEMKEQEDCDSINACKSTEEVRS